MPEVERESLNVIGYFARAGRRGAKRLRPAAPPS